MRSVHSLLTVTVAALALTACTGAPDRADEAATIRSKIAAMPGVSDVSTVYDNGIWEGTRYELDVEMPDATDAEVGAVAAEIEALRGDDFAEFDQRVEIDLGEGAMLAAADRLPDDAAQVAALIRRLRAEVTADDVTWRLGSSGSAVDVQDAAEPGRAVDAVLEVFADRPPDRIEVRPADRVADAHWDIRTRLTPEDKQRIDRELATAAPTEPGYVTVEDGRITHLTVSVPDPATAYRDVVGVIRAVGAGPARPMSLTWAWQGHGQRFNEPRWAGTAMIGTCDYFGGDRTKTEPLVPDALALQQRIRDEFDTCPK